MADLQRTFLARSYLYAPGNNERILQKVFGAGADAVILDLEDAVPPEKKREARRMVAEVLKQKKNSEGPRIYVRINSMSTDLWREDLEAGVQPAVHGIRLPKTESGEQMKEFNQALDEAEGRAGIGPLCVVPAVETAVGVLAAAEIAKGPRVESLGFGVVDFVRDIGVQPDPSGLQTLLAQSYVVMVSRAAGLIPPVASVHAQIRDNEGLRATSEAAKRLGFFGRSCLHPAQIPIIHEVFTPSATQVAEARAIVEAFNRAKAQGSGALAMENGEFIDKPVAERAQAFISLAESLQQLSKKVSQ